jgi:hypothetical protein
MKQIFFDIKGVNRAQVKEFKEELCSIKNVKGGFYIRSAYGEETSIPLALQIGINVTASILTPYIIKFFKKNKSKEKDAPIIINSENVQIIQGDKNTIIQEKIQEIMDNSKNLDDETQKKVDVLTGIK